MSTQNTPGALLHSDDEEARKTAASLMGKARSERKAEAARENGKKSVFTEEMRIKLREAQQARREREHKAREAAGIVPVVKEPKQPGRPRIHPVVEATGEKRGRGRPKKTQEGTENA